MLKGVQAKFPVSAIMRDANQSARLFVVHKVPPSGGHNRDALGIAQGGTGYL